MGGVSCEQNLPEEKTYTVKFDSDGGSEIKPVTVEDGGKVTKPEDPTRTGYTFKGWFNGDTEYDFEKAVTADITLKAKWEVVVVNYTVTFDSDGGSEVAAVEVKDGEKVIKPADPTKDGYTFKGWLDGEDVYDFEKAVTANITLKANWEVVTYNITYELNGGTGDEGNPKTYTIETADFTIKNLVSGPAATPNFVGWYSDKDLTKPAVTTITKGSTGNLSFYAKWSAKSTFTVTFNFVGVEGSDSVKVKDGEALTSAQLESVKSKISSDYVFEDFYTNQECTTKFDVTKKFTANYTLYVKVNEIKKFTVTFDSDGGSEVESAKVNHGAKVPKPADPTKDGYTFKGWFNGDKEYDFETAVTTNITLKAKWEGPLLPTTFKIGEIYSGKVIYPMVENSGFGNATASDVIFNIDLSEQTLKTKDVVKLTFKVTESSSYAINSLGYQSQIDSWGWHSINVKELGSTYNLSFEVGETTEFEGNLVGIKLVPQDSDGSLIGKDLVIKIEDLSVTLVPYVEGAKQTKVLYEGEGFAPYTDNFLASDLQAVLDSSTGDASLIITYKLGDYTPEYDYDGVAQFAGWDESWKDSKDNFSAYSINTGCSVADYVVGTEKEKSFAVSNILKDLSNTFRFTINIYSKKIVITNIKVEYTEK